MDCTIGDLLKKISKDKLYDLATDDSNPELTPDEVIEAASEQASEEIDGWLHDKTISQGMRKRLAISITLYNLAGGKGKVTKDEENPDIVFYENYKRAIDFLKLVAEGKIHQGQNPPAGIQVASRDKIFTDDFLAKY